MYGACEWLSVGKRAQGAIWCSLPEAVAREVAGGDKMKTNDTRLAGIEGL
jgi:hypothetical protein